MYFCENRNLMNPNDLDDYGREAFKSLKPIIENEINY